MARTHKEVLRDALRDPAVYVEYNSLGKKDGKITRMRRLRKAYRVTREEDAAVNTEWDAATMESWPEGPTGI